VLLENVPFMLHIKSGRTFDFIIGQLEELGYRWAYRVVDSRAFGLPQRRERVFILGALDGDPRKCLLGDDAGVPASNDDTTAEAIGFYWTEGRKGLGLAVNAVPTLKRGSALGIASPPAILMPSGSIVKPDIRDAERMQGFPMNWTVAAKGNHDGRKTRRWGLVGNAVTVDVAEWLGRRLRKPRSYSGEGDPILERGATWPRAAWWMGDTRHVSPVSTWPVRRQSAPLHTFLRYPGDPLSEKPARARSTSPTAFSIGSPST
jgi:DNA (cytosine-5)-methyltransferase 1